MALILVYALNKCDMRMWADSVRSGCGSVMGHCEHGDEHSGSVKRGEFVGQLGDYLPQDEFCP